MIRNERNIGAELQEIERIVNKYENRAIDNLENHIFFASVRASVNN